MRRSVVGLLLLFPVFLVARTGAGQEPPIEGSPEEPAEFSGEEAYHGSHFLTELGFGTTMYGSGGFTLSSVIGGGGKLPHLPLRLYLIGLVANDRASTSGTNRVGVSYENFRHFLDLGLGLRVYLPVYRTLRLLAELAAGASYVSARLEREELRTLLATGWVPLFQSTIGLQLRLLPQLSLGVQAKWVFYHEDVAGLNTMVSGDIPTRSTLAVTGTWHF